MVLLPLLYMSSFTWSSSIGASLVPYNAYSEESPTKSLIGMVDWTGSRRFARDIKGNQRNERIINGGKALDGEFPWMASVQTGLPEGSHHYCGGSIIGPKHILSAAHCFMHRPEVIQVLVGSNFLEQFDAARGQLIRVKKLITHPNFTTGPARNDIAILVLEEEIQWNNYTKMISLPTSEHLYGNVNVKAAGWGRTWGREHFVHTSESKDILNRETRSVEYSSVSEVLKVTNLTVFNNTECNRRWYKGVFELSDTQICAGASRETGDSVHGDTTRGDSGGPLVLEGNGGWTVVGLTSAAYGHAVMPGVYTRVSAYLPWIHEHLMED